MQECKGAYRHPEAGIADRQAARREMAMLRTTDESSSVCALPWYHSRAPTPGMYQAASTIAKTSATMTQVQLKFARETGYATGSTKVTCAHP